MAQLFLYLPLEPLVLTPVMDGRKDTVNLANDHCPNLDVRSLHHGCMMAMTVKLAGMSSVTLENNARVDTPKVSNF